MFKMYCARLKPNIMLSLPRSLKNCLAVSPYVISCKNSNVNSNHSQRKISFGAFSQTIMKLSKETGNYFLKVQSKKFLSQRKSLSWNSLKILKKWNLQSSTILRKKARKDRKKNHLFWPRKKWTKFVTLSFNKSKLFFKLPFRNMISGSWTNTQDIWLKILPVMLVKRQRSQERLLELQ